MCGVLGVDFESFDGFLGRAAWTEKAGFDKMRTNPASTMGQVAHPFDALWPNHFCTLL